MKVLLLFLLLVPWVHAQQPEQKKPKGYVRLVALGVSHSFELEEKKDERVEKKAPPGSEPPKVLAVSGTGEKAKTTGFSNLCKMTSYVEVQDKSKPVQLYQGAELKGKPWAKIRAPKVPLTAVFARVPYKDHRKLTWDKVRKVAVLNDDLKSFPLETVRFTNASWKRVGVKIGEGKVFYLNPGEIEVRKFPRGHTKVQIVQMKPGGGRTDVPNGGVELHAKSRINALIYSADGVKDRWRVRASFLPEVYKDPTKAKQPIPSKPPAPPAA